MRKKNIEKKATLKDFPLARLCGFLVVFLMTLCAGTSPAHANILRIYTDSGIPEDSVLWTWGGGQSTFNTVSDQESPERVQHHKTTGTSWAGWGIFFYENGAGVTRDLSTYAQGYLKFSVKTQVNFKVEVEGPIGTTKTIQFPWNGNSAWQEKSIPLSSFLGLNLQQIYCPFKITALSGGTLYVDNVRWEIPISGYTPSVVQVENKILFVDGSRLIVKGVSGEFTPVGKTQPSYDWSLHSPDHALDVSLIAGMGANTVRTYNQEPTQVQAMDMLYNNGLYVVMGFPVDAVYGNNQVVDFSNPVVRQNIKARFLEMVAHWKDHPTILMWCFGNEVNKALADHGVWPGHWYSLVEECAEAAHNLEGENYHPVTTANADQAVWDIGNPAKNADDASLPHLDIWSLQLYRGPSFGSAFINFKNSSAKPLLISEFGCDAYNGLTHQEDETMQANYLSSLWGEIFNHLPLPVFSSSYRVCVGGVLFAWRDGWWKSQYGTEFTHDTNTDWVNPSYADPNMNEEWFGVVAISAGTPAALTPRQGYYLWIWNKSQEREWPDPVDTGPLLQRNKNDREK